MLDHELDATVLRRVVALKRFALFGDVELTELATLAQNLSETTFAPGESIAEHPDAIHFVVEGAIALPGGGDYTAGDILGGLEMLAHRALPVGARATKPTRTLRLNADDMLELLDDNFGLLLAAIRAVAQLALAAPRRDTGMPALPGPLGLVERVLLLRKQAPFARARIRALTTLARASHELTWSSGSVIVSPSELATSSYVVVDGTVRVGAGDLLGTGHSFGLLETLAGRPHAAAFEAVTPVRALASTQAALLDVFEDHADLGVAVLRALAGDVLDGRNTRALTSSTNTR